MITKLDNFNVITADKIHAVFQNAYQVEALLIGVVEFPPLFRSAGDIVKSKTDFYGFESMNCLAAVVEVEINDKHLDIHSLTVDPKFFRQGIADKLIDHVLTALDVKMATVETAVVNKPAISLYKKHGFLEFKRWTPSHGIEKLAMSVNLVV